MAKKANFVSSSYSQSVVCSLYTLEGIYFVIDSGTGMLLVTFGDRLLNVWRKDWFLQLSRKAFVIYLRASIPGKANAV